MLNLSELLGIRNRFQSKWIDFFVAWKNLPKKEIKRLTDSNEAKDVKINHYKKQHEEEKEEIIELKNENFKLNNLLDDLKDKFKKALMFLRNKIFSINDDEREMYDVVLDDMADEGVLD